MEYNSFVLEGIKSDAEMKLQLEIIPKSHNITCSPVQGVRQSQKLAEMMCLNFCLGKKTNEYGKIKGHVNQL